MPRCFPGPGLALLRAVGPKGRTGYGAGEARGKLRVKSRVISELDDRRTSGRCNVMGRHKAAIPYVTKGPRMSVATVPLDHSSPYSGRRRLGPMRLLALFLVTVLTAGLSVLSVQMQAHAASNEPPIYGHGDNRFFAYLQPGESLSLKGTSQRSRPRTGRWSVPAKAPTVPRRAPESGRSIRQPWESMFYTTGVWTCRI